MTDQDGRIDAMLLSILLIRKGWFSNTSFTTGLKTLPQLMPEPAEKPSLHLSCSCILISAQYMT